MLFERMLLWAFHPVRLAPATRTAAILWRRIEPILTANSVNALLSKELG
jgi:hypothetical protein